MLALGIAHCMVLTAYRFDDVTAEVAMQRRLAAILAADVVGYSRLMGALASLKSHRRELVDSGIAEHHGRIVKTAGDGMLVNLRADKEAEEAMLTLMRVGWGQENPAFRQMFTSIYSRRHQRAGRLVQ